jgi:subtilisin family serine protease
VGLLAGAAFSPGAEAQSEVTSTYIVVFAGSETPEGFEVGGSNVLNLNAALGAVQVAGGVVTSDMTKEMGVAIVSSTNALFVDLLRDNPLVEAVGKDFAFQGFRGETSTPISVDASQPLVPGEDPLAGRQPIGDNCDPGETPGNGCEAPPYYQWGMDMIHALAARETVMGGSPAVTVAVLDTGIDPTHQDFFVGLETNIDVARARSFVAEQPTPFVDAPSPPWPHGTLVAGVIAARKNGLGIIGVAPDVTIVPIKVCGTVDLCNFTAVLNGINYAAEIQADVINMSFFIDRQTFVDTTLSGEPSYVSAFFCRSNPDDRAARSSLARAIHRARVRGALPVAAAGNDGLDLAADGDCDLLPAETPGVVTVSALSFLAPPLGPLTNYSNYGAGVVDIAAPAGYGGPVGGDDDGRGYLCIGTLTTSPGNSYLCAAGTSLAAPHVSGVAALIISQFGHVAPDGDMKMNPSAVEDILLGSAVDIGLPGEDKCYGVGRVDALRAVRGDTSYANDPNTTGCLR